MEYDDTVYACALGMIFSSKATAAVSIMEQFGSPGELFRLSTREMSEIFGKRSSVPEAIRDGKFLKVAEHEVRLARQKGIDMIYFRDKEYPARLRACPDAPIILYRKGSADLNPGRSVAIVGTRKPSGYGLEQCRKIVYTFSMSGLQPVIVSGLAYGIDICAHRSAIEYGLPTFGVMATGMDRIYPWAHRDDADRIIGQGCLLSDFPTGTKPAAFNFIRRNRIIAGMCDAIVVIESGIKGGSMITANLGISYSREIFALPGRITDPLSAGCNLLLEKNSAWAISSPESIIRNLGWETSSKETRQKRWKDFFEKCSPVQRNILLSLADKSPLDLESIIGDTGGDTASVLSGLTELEMEGAIETDLYGNYYLK